MWEFAIFMWKYLFFASIAYGIILLITKKFDKRKVKKYGRNITFDRNVDGNNADNDGNGNTDTNKQ